ncbi:probable methyltransferase TARBP1 isoform X2 [Meriones unguiculatus]|uniref:probable methyltransferase TARBP1 isoform X2 n=1 Tax=Meriones unguiculatus TaxID=10047 RepID=UPI000B4F3B0F|nr:probable methyltransferase TARBP1 isoform X2 [Meriones unguiculatus]
MERVLADALLAQSPEPRALLGALCGGEASAERAESLRLVLQRLEERGTGAQAAREVAEGHLVPLLRAPPAGGSAGPRVLRAVGAALRSCARLAGPELATALAAQALRELPGAPAVELLAAVAPCLRAPEDAPLLGRVARAAVELALAGDAPEAVGARLLPALAQSAEPAPREAWAALGAAGPGAEGRAGPELLVLSALAERLLPERARRADPDARLRGRFWRTVQAGLGCARDALTRKRARYLLQKAVQGSAELAEDCTCGPRDTNDPSLFWWSAKKKDELLKFWENYILIMEVLEGNQIHVIKPVLPKLNSLFESAVSEEHGCWLLHPSWHVCVYKRMFESENKTLTKEGVTHFLELYEVKPLPCSPELSEFVTGPLMDALSESCLYSRSPGQLSGSGPPLGLKLQKFLATYISLLPEETKSCFLLKFIQRMADRHWCAVPILFLSRALASLPRCKALGREGLLALRDVLQCTMITHQVLLRGAAQCYLLQAAMHLVDVEKVSLSEVSTFLTSLREEESLARGTVLWTELCDWLHVNERHFRSPSGSAEGYEASLNAYVKTLVKEFVKPPGWEKESSFMPDWLDARLTALMVLLAVDVEGMKTQFSEKQRTQNVLRIFLDPLLDTLGRLGTSAYMPVSRADSCLQLLVRLLHSCVPRGPGAQDDEVSAALQASVMSAAESVSGFLLRRLTMDELHSVADLDRCQLYLAVLAELTGLQVKLGWKAGNPISRLISPLRNACVHRLQEAEGGQEPTLGHQVQRVASMATLAALCEAEDQLVVLQTRPPDAEPVDSFLSALPLSQMLQKPRSEEPSSGACQLENGRVFEESSSSQGWGKIVTQYLHDQWVCLSFLLRKRHLLTPAAGGGLLECSLPATERPSQTLRSALDVLMVLPVGRIVPVFRCMEVLVPKLLTSEEPLCVESFDVAWKIVSSLSNTQLTFWPNLKAFVHFVFDNEILTIAAKLRGQAYFKIKEIMCKLIEMSSIKTGVFNALMCHCCQSWVAAASGGCRGSFSSAKDYSELVLEACVFGTVFRRDQRLIQDVQTFIENLGQDCAANVVIENTKREDYCVRICAVKFLCLLDGSDRAHKLFLEDLAIQLLAKDESASKSKTRYHENSLQHRVKNRVWQTLLVLFPRFDQNFLNRIIDKIFHAGFINNQASIKYFIEWIIVLILHKFPQFLPKFWACFSSGEEKLKTSICTFLSVLSHLDTIIQNVPEKTLVLKQALTVALQWCLSHNFSVRLYALVALKKVWCLCKALQFEECDAWSTLTECSLSQAESMHGAGNARKNWQRIQDHFFFSGFHPLKDYCLECLAWKGIFNSKQNQNRFLKGSE